MGQQLTYSAHSPIRPARPKTPFPAARGHTGVWAPLASYPVSSRARLGSGHRQVGLFCQLASSSTEREARGRAQPNREEGAAVTSTPPSRVFRLWVLAPVPRAHKIRPHPLLSSPIAPRRGIHTTGRNIAAPLLGLPARATFSPFGCAVGSSRV